MLYTAKIPFQITHDDRFGKGSLAISQKLMCNGNETTVWECENDVPSQRSFCSNNVRTKLDEDMRLGSETFIKFHSFKPKFASVINFSLQKLLLGFQKYESP